MAGRAVRFTDLANRVQQGNRDSLYQEAQEQKQPLKETDREEEDDQAGSSNLSRKENELGKSEENEIVAKPGPSEMTDMASVAWSVHVANKASGVMKEKATLRIKLKERMRQLVEDRLTVKQIFRRYVESSTLHGFRYTCAETYLIRRIIWACLMIAGAIIFIVKVKDGLRLYYSYPFSTTATIEYAAKLQFPAISFCPMNQFRISRLANSSLERLYNEKRLPLRNNWTDPGYDIPGDDLVKELTRTSFSIEDLIKDCDYIRRETDQPNVPHRNCSTQNFTSYFSATGQLCFTLNSGNVGHKMLEVENSGLSHGFELMFDLFNDDALKNHDFSGLQVILHDQSEPPVSSTGFILSPGFKTFIKIERTETHNLPPPFSTKCGVKKLKYYSKYNQKACLLELLADYTGEKCGCREPFMPDNGLPYCSLRQTTLCTFPAEESFNKHEMRELCPIDCHVNSFDTRISDSRFLHNPPIGVEPVLLKSDLKKKNLSKSHVIELHKKLNTSDLDKYIEENLLVVIFFYDDLTKVINTQAATFNFYNFLGDIGGTFGLVLGASLLTFFEFIDLFYFLLYHQLLRLHKEKKAQEYRKSMEIQRLSALVSNENNDSSLVSKENNDDTSFLLETET